MSRFFAANPTIQLLVFKGCPLAAAAREALRKALAELDIRSFEEIDILSPATPDELRGWGSPTILIDGEDVSATPKGNSVSCRVYSEPERIPSPATIVAKIRGQKAAFPSNPE